MGTVQERHPVFYLGKACPGAGVFAAVWPTETRSLALRMTHFPFGFLLFLFLSSPSLSSSSSSKKYIST